MAVDSIHAMRSARRRTVALPNTPAACVLRNPRPPYAWLDEEGLEQIHAASLDILENIGIDFLDDEALAIWQAAGARADHAARHVWIDRGLLLECIASAPPSFTWRARNPLHDVFIGENAIAFGPNGGMVFTHDLEFGRRPGVMADFEAFLKLSQMTPALHFASWEQVTMHDVPVSERHLRRPLPCPRAQPELPGWGLRLPGGPGEPAQGPPLLQAAARPFPYTQGPGMT